MKRVTALAALLFALSAAGGALAQSTEPGQIKEVLLVPLPTFEAADPGSKRSDLDKSDLAAQPPPWPILEVSDSGMYLVELKSRRVWVLDTTVKVDAAATGSALAPEIMNFNDKDLAGSRGYGD